jgi:outer membrane protein OmpA-like peptidoglycan-associated protein
MTKETGIEDTHMKSIKSYLAGAINLIAFAVLAFGHAGGVWGASSVTLSNITFAPGKTVDLQLQQQTGSEADLRAKVTYKDGWANIELKYKKLPPAILYGGDVTAYVLWSVTPAGWATNLGEVRPATDELEHKQTYRTNQANFALMVTGEPFFLAAEPSDLVLFASEAPGKEKKGITAATFSYSDLTPVKRDVDNIAGRKWSSTIPLALAEARKAFEVAGNNQAKTYALDLYQAADDSLSKAEQLFRARKSEKEITFSARNSVELSAQANYTSLNRQAAKAIKELEMARAAQMNQLQAQKGQLEAQKGQLEAQKGELEAQVAQMKQVLLAAASTIAEARASAEGVILTLPGILFALDKATLQPQGELALAKLSGVLLALPRTAAVVNGYTDSTGKPDYNQALSLKRATSVTDFLAKQGVQPSRMKAVGMGDQNPVASNDTVEGRAKNRRVEIDILVMR